MAALGDCSVFGLVVLKSASERFWNGKWLIDCDGSYAMCVAWTLWNVFARAQRTHCQASSASWKRGRSTQNNYICMWRHRFGIAHRNEITTVSITSETRSHAIGETFQTLDRFCLFFLLRFMPLEIIIKMIMHRAELNVKRKIQQVDQIRLELAPFWGISISSKIQHIEFTSIHFQILYKPVFQYPINQKKL